MSTLAETARELLVVAAVGAAALTFAASNGNAQQMASASQLPKLEDAGPVAGQICVKLGKINDPDCVRNERNRLVALIDAQAKASLLCTQRLTQDNQNGTLPLAIVLATNVVRSSPEKTLTKANVCEAEAEARATLARRALPQQPAAPKQ
jgi:hypothetical protein